jgi:hypothetical protein
MAELGLKATDWTKLSEKDKDDLKSYAAAEMVALGL